MKAGRLAAVVLPATFVTYVVTGYLGLLHASVHPAATAIWAPTGIALAAAVIVGRWAYPVIALASLTVNTIVLGPGWVAVVVSLGNTAEAALAAHFLARRAGGRAFLDSGRSAFTFCVLSGFVAPLLAAGVGATAISVHDGRLDLLPRTFGVWWLGDAGGINLVAPALLALGQVERNLWDRRRRLEFIALGAIAALVGGLDFFDLPGQGPTAYPLTFLVLPLAVWAAFRFTPRESTLINLILGAMMIAGALHGLGPFALVPEGDALVGVQVLLNIVALTTLPLAGGMRERREAFRALGQARAELEARVEARTAELVASNRRLEAEVEERSRAVAALAESQARLEEAQRSGQIGSWQWDVPANRISWSAELHRLFGREPGEFEPTFEDYRALLDPDDAVLMERVVTECMQHGGTYRFEHRVHRPDGTTAWIDGRGRAVFGPNGELIRLVGTGQDVTERKLAEVEVRRLNEDLERRIEARTQELARANQELESFNYSVSHDLRGPLRNIGGFAEIVQDELGDAASPEVRNNLGRIVANARRMNDIISGMLALANAGRTALEAGELDVSRMCTEVGHELAAAHAERRAELLVQPGMALTGDARLIRVLVTNLLSNAWKFTARLPPGTARIEVSCVIAPEGPVLCVRDNGAGFDAALTNQLFLPFRRLHHRNEFDGTGIGLATVARIAERHGGGVRAEGAVGQGAAFFVHLPALRVTSGEA